VKAQPIITDYEFDMELKRLKQMEEESGQAEKDSPTQIIWGDSESQYPEWVKEHMEDKNEQSKNT
jgi:NAD-dependent DNA ligase